jgi:hypothetical protein
VRRCCITEVIKRPRQANGRGWMNYGAMAAAWFERCVLMRGNRPPCARPAYRKLEPSTSGHCASPTGMLRDASDPPDGPRLISGAWPSERQQLQVHQQHPF